MKYFLLLTLAFFFFAEGFAQTKIEGVYDPQYKRYIANANLTSHARTNPYDIDDVNHGFAIIKNTQTNTFGVIDSTGAIRVPLIYNLIEEIERAPGFFIFYSSSEMGILNNIGNEILKVAITDNKARIRSSSHKDFVFVEQNNKIGLINLRKSRIIIPVECDFNAWYEEKYERSRRLGYHIELNEYSAIAKKNHLFYVFNLTTGQSSGPYVDVMRTGPKHFFVKDASGKCKIIDLDFQTDKKIPGTIIDAHDEYVISQQKDKFGLYTTNGSEVIAPLYDDLYLINDDAAWVKKDGFWAMFYLEKELQTPFEFLDIEKTNELFLENLLWVTQLDTTNDNLHTFREYSGINECPNHLKSLIFAVQQLKGSKRLFNTYLDRNGSANYSFAKKADGYHVTYPPLLKVEPEAWDMVYYVPDCIDPNGMIGYKKGNKYGLDKQAVKYEGLLYDALELRMNCNNGCLISRGMIMSYTVDYTGNKGCYFSKAIPFSQYKLR